MKKFLMYMAALAAVASPLSLRAEEPEVFYEGTKLVYSGPDQEFKDELEFASLIKNKDGEDVMAQCKLRVADEWRGMRFEIKTGRAFTLTRELTNSGWVYWVIQDGKKTFKELDCGYPSKEHRHISLNSGPLEYMLYRALKPHFKIIHPPRQEAKFREEMGSDAADGNSVSGA